MIFNLQNDRYATEYEIKIKYFRVKQLKLGCANILKIWYKNMKGNLINQTLLKENILYIKNTVKNKNESH